MKKSLLVIMILLISRCSFGQSVIPNATVPIPLPVPIPPNVKRTIAKVDKKECNADAKLIAFSLPCCISADTLISIENIATIAFDNMGCKKPTVIFTPAFIVASDSMEKQTITASAGDVKITAIVSVIKKNPIIITKSAPFSFENEAEQFKSLLASLKNGAVPICENTGNTLPIGNLSYQSSTVCCGKDSCAVEQKIFSGAYLWDYSMTCQMPIYGIPVLKSVASVIIGDATMSVTVNEPTNCLNPLPCYSVIGKAGVGGKTKYIPKGMINADINISSDASYDTTGCRTTNAPQKFSCNQLEASGKITDGWGLISHTFHYNIYSRKDNQ